MKSLKFLCLERMLIATVSSFAQQEIIIVERKDYKTKEHKKRR